MASESGSAAQPLRVALIGSGSIARQHLLAYRQFPDIVELVAVCDVNEAAAQRFTDGTDVRTVFTDVHEALAYGPVEAVDICTPHDQHAPIAIAAADAGKHVLLEKPMATSMQECREIVAAAERAGVTFMVGQHLRQLPAYRGVRALLERGELGAVWSARFDNWLPTAVPGTPMRSSREQWWGFDGKRSGGGVLPMLATHHIDLFRYFFGDVRSVLGYVWRDNPRFTNGAEDRALATLECESGVVGHLSASYSTRGPHDYQFMVLGDRGTLYTQAAEGATLIERHQSPAFVWSSVRSPSAGAPFEPVEPVTDGMPTAHPFVNEIVHFARCCRNGEEPISGGRDNLKTMQTLFAIYESARLHRMVDVANV